VTVGWVIWKELIKCIHADAHWVMIWSIGTGSSGMASWLLVWPVLLGSAAMVAAHKNCTGRVHIYCIGGLAVLCMVFTSWVMLKMVTFAFSMKTGGEVSGERDEVCHVGVVLVIWLEELFGGVGSVYHDVRGCSSLFFVFKHDWWHCDHHW